MKTRLVAIVALGLCVMAGTANAQLLNPVVGPPAISFDNSGTLHYDAVAQTFTMNATALAYVDGNGAHLIQPLGIGTVALVIPVDNTGALIAGSTTSVDLVVSGPVDLDGDTIPEYSGVLLTARVTAFGHEDTGTTSDKYDALLVVTGGSLAGVMPGKIGLSFTSENSTFTGDFTADFHGRAKGAIGSIFGNGCGLTPGYWKNHPEDWVVTSLNVGGVTYNFDQLMNLLNTLTPDGQKAANDMSVKLAKFIVATKLSILAGADPLDIEEPVLAGDALLAEIGIGSNPKGDDYTYAALLKGALDTYLNLPCDCEEDSDDYLQGAALPAATTLSAKTNSVPPGQAKKNAK
ncbi:MAG: hypothetical protein BIFFINMI_02570 [Phycisphaerae bacterium]|nr:hypothetical protein [Phycisphaerae bacterium]